LGNGGEAQALEVRNDARVEAACRDASRPLGQCERAGQQSRALRRSPVTTVQLGQLAVPPESRHRAIHLVEGSLDVLPGQIDVPGVRVSRRDQPERRAERPALAHLHASLAQWSVQPPDARVVACVAGAAAPETEPRIAGSRTPAGRLRLTPSMPATTA